MFDRWLRFPIHGHLQALGAAIVAFGMPLNKVLMSIGTIWLAANVLIKADFKSYKKVVQTNRIVQALLLFLAFYLVSLAWSQNLEYAIWDLRTKLPFFALPFSLFLLPVAREHYGYVFAVFFISLCITSGINILSYHQNPEAKFEDIRYLSRFGSHIRYGIIVVFAIALCTLYFFRTHQIWLKIMSLTGIAWFGYYTFISQVLSAYVALMALFAVLMALFFYLQPSKLIRYGGWTLQVTIIILMFSWIYNFFKIDEKTFHIELSELPIHSKSGEPYKHDLSYKMLENGNLVMVNIAEHELRNSWNNRASIPYDSLDNKGQPIFGTILRYMTSLGLTKDNEGVAQLSANDIALIEQGITSAYYAENHWKNRLEGLKVQVYNYHNGFSPSGHSLLQRIEHWKTAMYIIQQNWLIGVGVGDVQDAFDNAYEEMNTPLEKDYWNRSHNQFLTMLVATGFIGLICFLLIWYFSIVNAFNHQNWWLLAFVVVVIASFLPEDTLETQQGVTFVGFFLGFLPMLNFKKH
ncbi:MAG: O-antigen ligase family protein [Crocinitomicaceae bacterium]|nr:O-antigen ligase family protein [Crocinitomicaceae bacterium]